MMVELNCRISFDSRVFFLALLKSVCIIEQVTYSVSRTCEVHLDYVWLKEKGER